MRVLVVGQGRVAKLLNKAALRSDRKASRSLDVKPDLAAIGVIVHISILGPRKEFYFFKQILVGATHEVLVEIQLEPLALHAGGIA